MKNTILRKIDGVAKSIYETNDEEISSSANVVSDVLSDTGVSPLNGEENLIDFNKIKNILFYYNPFGSDGYWDKRSLENNAKEMALSAAVNVANPVDPTPPPPPPPPPSPKPDSTETPGMFTRMGKDLDSLSPMTKGILGGAAVGIPIALTGIHLYNKYKRNNQNQYNGYQSQQYQNNYNY